MNPEVNSDVLHTLPVLPLKNAVLFPDLFVPLTAGRAGSVAAVEAALTSEDKTIVLLTQRDASVEQPGADDLYTIGTRGVIKKVNRAEGGLQLLVQGLERVAVVRVEQTEPYLQVRVRTLPVPDDNGVEVEALTAVSVAALTIYDMCKSLDRGMSLGPFVLVEKSGGKSGHFVRDHHDA